MNSTVTEVIKNVLPWIGTALGGPLGTGVATFVASKLGIPADTVTDTLASMVGDPQKLLEAKKLELDYKAHCLNLGYQHIEAIEALNASVVIEVNKTMQVEAASEHWATYTWRPFNGYLFGITIFGTYFILPLMKITPPVMPEFIWIAWGGILGVASFFRGKMQADPTIPPVKNS